ncbi:YicC/YloC family endoribonuclease [Enterococcus faecalis]
MKSMTGFGKAANQNDTYQIDIEVKTVNQRFLDMQLRIPKEANPYEMAIRQLIKANLQRGRIEAYVNVKQISSSTKEVCVHWELLDPLLNEIQQHMAQTKLSIAFNTAHTLNHLLERADFIEVIEKQEVDETFGELLLQTFEAALAQVLASRSSEGEKIQQVLTDYTVEFEAVLKQLAKLSELFEAEYRDRFEAKLKDWLGAQVDETRLLTEMAILLEKGDIHEELDRLVMHGQKLHCLLTETAPVGRELDFLLQEMNREVNTIGSKSTAIEIKNKVVQLKTILEKIREQIQNVE